MGEGLALTPRSLGLTPEAVSVSAHLEVVVGSVRATALRGEGPATPPNLPGLVLHVDTPGAENV